MQILRSSTLWSAGIPLEHSIMNAWIGAIDKAEHFIYIEVLLIIISTNFHHIYCSVSPKGRKGGTPPFHQANNYKGNSTDQLKIAQSQSQHI